AGEIYLYLIEQLSDGHPDKVLLLVSYNRLILKSGQLLNYIPIHIKKSSYVKAVASISQYDIDEAQMLLSTAERYLIMRQFDLCSKTLSELEKRPIVQCPYTDSYFVRSQIYNLKSKLLLNTDVYDCSMKDEFLSLIEDSRSYCAQDLRTSLDIMDINRISEMKQFTFSPAIIHTLQTYLSQVLYLILLNFEIGLYRNSKNYILVGLEISLYLHSKRWFTLFLILNSYFFILSHQSECCQRKFDQIESHLKTFDYNDDLFVQLLYKWFDYVKCEYVYHTENYMETQKKLRSMYMMYEDQQDLLSHSYHRLIYKRLHVLYRLTYFQINRLTSTILVDNDKIMWETDASSLYVEFEYWIQAWLTWLSIVEQYPPEVISKLMWLSECYEPKNKAKIKCLSQWTENGTITQTKTSTSIDPKLLNNPLSPPNIFHSSPINFEQLSTEALETFVNNETSTPQKKVIITSKNKKQIDTPRGKNTVPSPATPLKLASAKLNEKDDGTTTPILSSAKKSTLFSAKGVRSIGRKKTVNLDDCGGETMTTTPISSVQEFMKNIDPPLDIVTPIRGASGMRKKKQLVPIDLINTTPRDELSASRPNRRAKIVAERRIHTQHLYEQRETIVSTTIATKKKDVIQIPSVTTPSLRKNSPLNRKRLDYLPPELLDEMENLQITPLKKGVYDEDDDEDVIVQSSQIKVDREQQQQPSTSRPLLEPNSDAYKDLLSKCFQLYNSLSYLPSAKLYRYLCEYLILLLGDQQPWMVATLIVSMQSMGFRYNALCIYQRKNRKDNDKATTTTSGASTPVDSISRDHLQHYIDAFHFRPLTIDYLKFSLINELPSKQVCLCFHYFSLIKNCLLLVQIRSNYYEPCLIRLEFPKILIKKFHYLIESNTKTLHGINDHKRYWLIRKYFERLFEFLLDDLNQIYLQSPVQWYLLPETTIFDCKKQMIDDALSKYLADGGSSEGNSVINKRFIEFCLHQTTFYLQNEVDIKEELRKLLKNEHLCTYLSEKTKLIETFLKIKQRTYQQQQNSDGHAQNLLLFLDNHLHTFPWEQLSCMSSLYKKVISHRLPTIILLDGMYKYYNFDLTNDETSPSEQQQQQQHSFDLTLMFNERQLCHRVDLNNGYYIVDPGNDLPRTKKRFQLFKQQSTIIEKWDGIIEAFPNQQQIKDIFQSREILLYMGHGSGSQFYPVDDVQKNSSRMCVLLMGCSSARLQSFGDFEAFGMPFAYLTCGAASVVGCLWDVTDRDIDTMTFHLIERLKQGDSLGDALKKGRLLCKLQCLNGAAPVIYGLPIRAIKSN
ncbi:unnamed protein product, partial [Didymodactylos carnosus]